MRISITGADDGQVFQPPENINAFKDKRIFKEGNKYVCLNLKDIIFVCRENRRVAIYHMEGKFTTKSRLSDVERQLGECLFYRSHEGFIINLSMVKELTPIGKNSYEVVLANTDKKALMTREKFKELKKLINNDV